MCVAPAVGLAIASLVVSLAATATSTVISSEQADAQEALAQEQANFERSQALKAQQEAAEAAAEERVTLAEEAARARGRAQNAGLGGASLQRFLVDIARREGRSNAIISRNLELVNDRTAAQVRGIQLAHAGRLLDIDAGRPNAAVAALSGVNQLAGGTLKVQRVYEAQGGEGFFIPNAFSTK